VWRFRLAWERLARSLICSADHLLRGVLGIHEFSEDDECILRLSRAHLRHTVELQDGSQLYQGACVGELHLWNQHLACILGPCRSLGTGARLRTRLLHLKYRDPCPK